MKSPLRGLSTATVCLLLGIASSLPTRAVTVDNFQARVFTNAQGKLPYRLFVPTNYTVGTQYPVVLFLHGAGESGTDNRLQLTGQTGELVFASETNQLKYPSFMVAPQCLLNGAWADSIRRAQVLGLMKALQSEFNIDSNRLYITGLSLGESGPGITSANLPACTRRRSQCPATVIRPGPPVSARFRFGTSTLRTTVLLMLAAPAQ